MPQLRQLQILSTTKPQILPLPTLRSMVHTTQNQGARTVTTTKVITDRWGNKRIITWGKKGIIRNLPPIPTITKRIVTIKGQKRILTWEKGKRGITSNKPFKPVGYMWRTTLTVNYAWHSTPQNPKYYSYKATAYATNKKDLPNREKLEEQAKQDFVKRRGYTWNELEEQGDQVKVGYEPATLAPKPELVPAETVFKDEPD